MSVSTEFFILNQSQTEIFCVDFSMCYLCVKDIEIKLKNYSRYVVS